VRVLLIDNYDSFTYNLFQLMAQVYGDQPCVITNDDPSWDQRRLAAFDALVISPGPGHPEEPRNLGISADLLCSAEIPVLGVCLGHQAIAYGHGSPVQLAPAPRHGYLSQIRHDEKELFVGVPQNFTAVRYHSLSVPGQLLAPSLRATAWAEDGVVMGLRHVSRPLWGVQFHPESVLTEHGPRLLQNFERLAQSWHGTNRRRSHPAWPSRAKGMERTRTTSALDVPGTWPAAPEDAGWEILHEEMPGEVDAAKAFAALFSHCGHAFWLDSSRTEPGLARFSFFGAPLGPHGEVLQSWVGQGTLLTDTHRNASTHVSDSIFTLLADRTAARCQVARSLPFDFDCGYVGYFGYELKAELGSPNSSRATSPDALWMAATRAVAVDHEQHRTYLLALAKRTDQASAADARSWLRSAQQTLASFSDTVPHATTGPHATTALDQQQRTTATDPEPWLRRAKTGYLADIRECLRQLRSGESYEICLTTKATIPFAGDPFSCYLTQRRQNPAPYAAYLRLGDTHVLCSSPERFIRVDRDRCVESKPIKGTASRDPNPDRDRQLADELASDPKARAENLMIVDLLRNDLGRVCEVGSVIVSRLMHVESYATVHQLVSTIRGKLLKDVSAVHCVRACFPGGSMTGAPKKRTMEILDRLEDGPRGIYSGCLGYFGRNGTADLNIVIRTAIIQGDSLSVGAGGAIVLDSVPGAEYTEMLMKARAAVRGMEITAIGARKNC
jgi:para-aminobenzoate synthetase